MLRAAQNTLEANLGLALLHEAGGENDAALLNVAVGASINLHRDAALSASEAARLAGNSPNTVLAAACTAIGPARVQGARRAMQTLLDVFLKVSLADARDAAFDVNGLAAEGARERLIGSSPDPKAEAMLSALEARGAQSVFVRFVRALGAHPTPDAVLAAIAATVAWGPLMRRRISLTSALNLPWWLRLMGTLIGASVPAARHEADRYCGVPNDELLRGWSLTEIAGLSLFGRKLEPAHQFALQTLIGLLLTNGPGTISAQGAKGAVAADGSESPDRVQLNKAVIGFLTHTGYAHGGNGLEGITFLIEQFRESGLDDPGNPNHGLDLAAMAARYCEHYATYKSAAKAVGRLDLQMIPGVHHPVFRDKAVNHDPREVFIAELFAQRREHNVFHDFYHALVRALYDAGLSRNVYCVNIDGVIAALLLKMMWQPYRAGTFTEPHLETAAFTVFLFGRMVGCAAEIEDHLNRGRNMDTRTAASECRFVA
jgi:hypothetical protein